jgi:hypothetical protein
MRTDTVEIYSDLTNSAIMRHPGRKFPGVLVQGDTMHIWCSTLDAICQNARGKVDEDTYIELNELRNRLWSSLTHYKQVLGEHGISLPFSEAGPRS